MLTSLVLFSLLTPEFRKMASARFPAFSENDPVMCERDVVRYRRRGEPLTSKKRVRPDRPSRSLYRVICPFDHRAQIDKDCETKARALANHWNGVHGMVFDVHHLLRLTAASAAEKKRRSMGLSSQAEARSVCDWSPGRCAH